MRRRLLGLSVIHDTRNEVQDRSSKIKKNVTNHIKSRKSEKNEKRRRKEKSKRQLDEKKTPGVSYDTRMNRKIKKVPTNSTTAIAHARNVLVVILSLMIRKDSSVTSNVLAGGEVDRFAQTSPTARGPGSPHPGSLNFKAFWPHRNPTSGLILVHGPFRN